MQRCSRLRIHRSVMGRSATRASARGPSRFIRMNRAAFQSLFAKFRYPSMRSSDNLMSRPGDAIAASVNRRASVPYLSITSSGSITLPLDLLSFCRQRKGFWSLQEGPRITTTVHAVPRWDLMPPPDLTRNAPILDVSHPGQVVVRPLRWNQADLCGFDGLDRRPGQRLNFHEPLRRKIGFHHRLAAVALAECHGMVFDPGQKATLLQGFHYESPSLTHRFGCEAFLEGVVHLRVAQAGWIEACLLVEQR